MNRQREWLVVAAVAIAAGAAGYGYNASRSAPDTVASQDGVAAMNAMRLPDLTGKPQALDQWRGKVVVVNFWATWCAPCREEIPLFVRLQDKYRGQGLQFVGIAIDQPEKVRPYAAELGMNFPVLIGGIDGLNLARTLGNRAAVLPFTVIVGRDGKIASTAVGAAKEPQFEAGLQPLLSASPYNAR